MQELYEGFYEGYQQMNEEQHFKESEELNHAKYL